MRATITKIHPLKSSRNRNSFIRVEFQLETGEWAKTDLCPDFRNFARWRDVLKAGTGTSITGVVLNPKRKNEINADSFPSITTEPLKKHEIPKPTVKQLPLL